MFVCGVRESERRQSSVEGRRGEWKGNTEEEEMEKGDRAGATSQGCQVLS